MAFCGMPPPCVEGSDQIDSAPSSPVAQSAVVCTGVIWKGRGTLKVHFLNPEVLEGWGRGLTTGTILDWARTWGDFMEFEETANRKKADIRIEFSGTYNCAEI